MHLDALIPNPSKDLGFELLFSVKMRQNCYDRRYELKISSTLNLSTDLKSGRRDGFFEFRATSVRNSFLRFYSERQLET